MTNLVIYYTRTNNTKLVAQTIKEEIGADLLEIKDKKNRSGPIGYLMGAIDAFRGKTTDINYEDVDLKAYDTIFLGTPVWAAKPAPAIMEFIKENDFDGLQVITFATMGSTGGKSTVQAMNNLIINKDGNVKKSFSIAVSGNDIKELTIDSLRKE
ncbi:MAG: hypothetical protein BZ138_03975 [Methanosphaera sp. rholeuAM270]|nr:MAG: hypothetical protein BZ138_03975 [Methanosphaera sp. rholeuAM270]